MSATVREIVNHDWGWPSIRDGFTKDALNAANNSANHIETTDLERFIGLWTTFYPDMTEEDRLLMPLTDITFYSPPN